MIRVVLVDDHPVVRSGILGYLKRAVDINVVGEASSGTEALQRVEEVHPDVLLMDMNLPDMNGVELVRKLKDAGAPVKILVLSAYDDETFIHELVKIGVSGYLIKGESPETIVDAIRGVAVGDTGWYSREISAQVLKLMRDGPEKKRFTAREKEVAILVTQGKTNRQIASELSISEKTVEKYMENLMKKLDASSRVQVAVISVRDGLV